MSAPAQVTEAHRKIAEQISDSFYGCPSQNWLDVQERSAQLIADREAKAVEHWRTQVDELRGALALGQENCDDVYDDLREERDAARAGHDKLRSEIDSRDATYQRMCEVEHELRAETERLTREVGQLFIEKGRLVARADRAEFMLKQSQKWDTVAIINARDEFQQRTEKAESELAGVHEARRAWLGDDYAHLEIGDALAKLRANTEAELASEREKVRVLRETLIRRHDEQSYYARYVDVALAATEDAPK